MFRLGLTGGIGSGKSTVAAMLQSFGAALIDADAISRQSTQAGGAAIEPIRQHFGSHALTPEGALNRHAMRDWMARDSAAKARLESIVHPIVGEQIKAQLKTASKLKKNLAVLDLPLLAEGGSRWRTQLDTVWVVDCLPETQQARIVQRSGWQPEHIQGVMALQVTRAQRLACADAVIYNEGLALDQLQALVRHLAEPLL
ncbi:MAG: dephospho-CoA kinase [Brachymonas sp.]